MSYRAWIYISTVLVAGLAFSLKSLLTGVLMLTYEDWLTFAVLATFATFTHLYEAKGPGRHSYYPSYVFFFAGVLLLPPTLFVLLILLPHVAELIKDRIVHSSLRRAWYVQPFNVAMHIVAGTGASAIHRVLQDEMFLGATPSPLIAVTIAALSYVLLNNIILGQALVLARGISWRQSGVLHPEHLLAEGILVCLGYVVSILWQINPWLILPAVSPLGLMYRALMVPQLKQEAQNDVKTGLYNARYFSKTLAEELARAQRFNRPLALIMADLDLMRDINNTYGHLAGDAVLAGIGQIIRTSIREYDVAGRFGGEEFAIVLPETDADQAVALAERLRAAIAATEFTVETSPTPIRATMSIGVACFPNDGTTEISLVHEADVAVYHAKASGRNRVVAAADVPDHVKEHHQPDSLILAEPTSDPAQPASAQNVPAANATPEVREASQQQRLTALQGMTHNLVTRLFLGSVMAVGGVVALLSFILAPQIDYALIGLLCYLAVLAELLHVHVNEKQSISVSVALLFAAALLTGIPGVVCVSAAIAMTHHLKQYHRRRQAYKTLFNWGTHVLAGSMPALLAIAYGIRPDDVLVPSIALLMIVGAVACYAVESTLMATAISLTTHASMITTWRSQYQWLAPYYLVLCLLGVGLAAAYTAFGFLGACLFMLIVVLLHYAQRQYATQAAQSMQELRELHHDLLRSNEAVHQLNYDLFQTLARILDARDAYPSGHAMKVAEYATAVAHELGLAPERIDLVRQAALLHDIGKVAIAEQLLTKPAKLTADEYEHVKQHATLGAELVETSRGLRHLAPIVRHHHERWDGQGYPQQLSGENIPLESRILAVCDAVQAMASDRPYHHRLSSDAIIAEVQRCAGTQFDPAVAHAFVRLASHSHVLNASEQSLEHPSRSVFQPINYAADDGWYSPAHDSQR